MSEEKSPIEVAKDQLKPTETLVLLTERVTVYATKEAPYHSEGEEIKCVQHMADYLIAKGWATAKKGK